MTKVKPIPEGYHSITPYLVIRGAAKAIEFYKLAFEAEEHLRLTDPKSGQIGHAELRIGDSIVMLADEHPEMGYRAPGTLGGTPVSLMLYVTDVDATAERAVAAGAKVVRPVVNQFYGDRSGQFEDPFGHVWTIATHVEDVAEDELARRVAEAFQQA